MVPKVVSNIENAIRFDGFHVIGQNIEAFLSLAAQYRSSTRGGERRVSRVAYRLRLRQSNDTANAPLRQLRAYKKSTLEISECGVSVLYFGIEE